MITDKQKHILSLLRKDPYLSQQKIADTIKMSRSATANLITQLVEKGYIIGKAYVLSDKLDRLMICIGGANVDKKLICEAPIELYTSNRIKSSISLGGAMRNVAENAGRLGVNISLLSIIGEDSCGDLIIDSAQGFFQTHKMTRLGNRSTGSYYALLDHEQSLIAGLADMSIADLMDSDWIYAQIEYIRQGSSLTIDTNVKKSAIEAIIQISREESIPLVIIGASVAKMDNLPKDIKNVDLGIFNLRESQAYFNSNEDSELLAHRWIEEGFDQVIITDSTNPVVYANETKIVSYPVRKAENIQDNTGASDSFVAGVLYGLYQNKPLIQSIYYGMANASLNIQSKDTVNPLLTAELLEKELENYK